ncbi:MAG: ABC transporter permease subunit [Desulfobulbus sp.]|nr:ABC transporter permease subunit [Desulfobulbus sp.]
MMRKIWALARLVCLDGLRRHALIGLVLLAFGLEAGGLLFFEFIPRDVGRASGDFILSVGWLTGLLFLLFHAVQVMAWDEERRTIHTFLARPISRTQYVLGIFLGLAALLVLLNLVLALLGYWVLVLIKNSLTPIYFQHLSPFNYALSWAGLFCIELMILAIIMLFSGLVRGGFPVLLLAVSYAFICTGLPVVRASFANRTDLPAALQRALQWLTALFPDFSRFDFKEMITDESTVNLAQGLATDLGLLALYLIIALWAAALVYQRRDLK